MLSIRDSLKFSLLDDPSECSPEWDDLIVRLDSGHIYQSRMWAQYKQKVGWRPILLSWSNNESPKAVCLLLHRSIAGLPFGGILYAPRGPVLDYSSPEAPHLFSQILTKLVHLARRHFAVVRVSPYLGNEASWVAESLQAKGFFKAKNPISHTATIRLDMTPSMDQIFGGMEKRRREDVRRYERRATDWSVRISNSFKSLETLYSLYLQSITEANAFLKDFNDIQVMHKTLNSTGSTSILTVEYQNQPVASALIATLGNRAWPMYIGTAKGAKSITGAGVALYWEMFKWLKGQEYVEYDFHGLPEISGPDDPFYGVYLFKRGWGGKKLRLIGEYDYAPYPFLGKLLNWNISRLGS